MFNYHQKWVILPYLKNKKGTIMNHTIEIKHQNPIQLCNKRLNITSIKYSENLKLPRNIPLIINSIDKKSDILDLMRTLKYNIHSNPIIILTQNKHIKLIVDNLNQDHIQSIYSESKTQKDITQKMKKTIQSRTTESLSKRIKKFKQFCKKKTNANESIHLEDFIQHFPECKLKAISQKSILPEKVIQNQLELIFSLLTHNQTQSS